MFTKILGIIESILKLVIIRKTDTSVISAEKQKKQSDQFDKYTKEIEKAHKTDDLDTLRKYLGD